MWAPQPSGDGWTVVTRKSVHATSRDRGDDAGSRGDFPNPLIKCVCDEQVARKIYSNSMRSKQLSRCGWTIVSGKPKCASSGNSSDYSGSDTHLANRIA